MPGYHDFVFDKSARQFIGRFEDMYQAEQQDGFDSWNQDDLDQRFEVQAMDDHLSDCRFPSVIDIGCGKGALTHRLSNLANRSVGLDISVTAVGIASRRYPDSSFRVADINDPVALGELLRQEVAYTSSAGLIVLSQVLSYLSRWKEVLQVAATHSTSLVVALYLPNDPIGFVKNKADLQEAIEGLTSITKWVQSADGTQHVVFATPLFGCR